MNNHNITDAGTARWLRVLTIVFFYCLYTLPAQALERHQQSILFNGDKHQLTVPSGYQIEILASRLDGPRMLGFADNADLFIGSRSGKLYRLTPPYTQPEVLVTLADYPHSVALRQNEILIAQTDGLYHAPYKPGQEKIAPETVSLLAALPGGSGHNSRTVRIGPDKRVYVSLGISGNCSNQYLDDSYPLRNRRGGVLVLNEDKAKAYFEPFASGLRNPVGFDWHPHSGVLYASNNGPDHHGFEQPPEYFSRLDKGSFHGMPWFQFDGKSIRRDQCIKQKPPRPSQDVDMPVATFPARSAPMGIAFVPDDALDQTFTGDAIVALRGSWGTRPGGGFTGNPSTRRHPKIVRVVFREGKATAVEDLITGFQLADGKRLARPVGVAIGPDGALYFTSDSQANALFRLRKIP